MMFPSQKPNPLGPQAPAAEPERPVRRTPWLMMVLGLSLGGFLAAWGLVFKPVKLANTLSTDTFKDVRNVYFIPGQRSESPRWTRVRRTFLKAEGAATVDEEQLNQWARNIFHRKNTWKEAGIFSWGRSGDLNFRIENNVFQIAQSFQMKVAGEEERIVYQLQGQFKKEDGRWVLVPRKSYLGSCPIPSFLSSSFFQFVVLPFFSKTAEFEKLSTSWEQLAQVEVDANLLKFEF